VPTYSYRCTECGHAFDIQQAFTDATLTECPSCGGALRKIFSPVGITFNGSGFYRTDSRAKSAGDKGGADKGGAGSDAGKATKERSGSESASGTSTPSKADGGGSTTPTKTSTPSNGSGTKKAATSSAAS
jgi:putative FmdB family regulatory protein